MGHSRRQRVEEIVARELALMLALLVVALAQTTLLPRLSGVAPNLMLLLAVCHGLVAGTAPAARWSFYGGLALDLCAMSLLGSHSLALLAGVVVATWPLARFRRGNWLVPIAGVALGGLAYHTVYALLTALFVAGFEPAVYALYAALPDILIVLTPALPLYMALRWNQERTRRSVPVDVY
ncbi:MAG: hypothetical protein HXY39_06775 [Chloroflexi bacterium]|nr:hypothetical protein [Chloroflexota bacterium]